MQTLTFTQKLLRQRSFFSLLLPLFAIFVGLGASQQAVGQTITNTDFYVDNTPGSNVNTTYGGSSNRAPLFAGANLGTFDINNPNDLLLNGGQLTFTAPNGSSTSAPTDATLNFRIYSPASGSYVSTPQTISLTLISSSGRDYVYSTTNAQRSLIALVPSSGNYEVDASYTVNYGRGDVATDVRRSANFTVTGTRIAPTGIGNSNVFINLTGATTPNLVYGASSGAIPNFNGANLGSFDINSGKLTLNGGNATTFESGGDVVQSARLNYLIVKPMQPGTPQGIAFPQSSIALSPLGTPTTANGGTSRTYSNATALRNLIAGLANYGIGTYTINVTYEAIVLRANGSTYTVRDDNGGNGYVASFTTTGVPILIDTWTGGVSDDWFTPGNWDLGFVPTANTNVVIPDFGVGNSKPYPNINAGVIYTTTSGTSKDNRASGPALCRDLTMQGTSQAQRSICRLINGRLRVFGSFDNAYLSFIQRLGTVTEFAGSGNQTITGGSFTAVELSGGGTKALTGLMEVTISMTFLPQGGLFTTDISAPADNYLSLAGRSADAPDGAQLIGESDAAPIPSYVRGFIQTTRSDVRANETVNNIPGGTPDPRTFGNIGITLYFKGTNNPGDVLVTRNTAESYTPLVPVSLPPGTSTSRYGIRRIFGVRPGSPNTNSGGLLADMTFRYLDSELSNLGPNGNGSVPEPNLALFVSTSGGNQFGYLGVDQLDQTANILTKNNVRTFATFTLGDKNNPLPVSLTGLLAKRIGNDAQITWETASEKNSKGYDVQVSTDGREFRTLGFVASKSANSIMPQSYSFVDVEKNKAGTRYYRLRQIDLDGKETFYGPRTVSFEGKAAEAAVMTAYPNPFNGADQLHLTLQSSQSGTGSLSVIDMTGRTVRQQKVDITTGSNDVSVDRLNDLKSGLYQVRFVLPSGEVQNLKVMKQ